MIEGLDFDDVLLIPKKSSINSRDLVDTKVNLGKNVVINFPILPSNMKDVATESMMKLFLRLGGLFIKDRFSMKDDEYINFAKNIFKDEKNRLHIGLSVGAKDESYNIVNKIVSAGCHIILVDLAHGHSDICLNMVKYISDKYPDVLLMAGNTVTSIGATELWNNGADIVKVGVGNGCFVKGTKIKMANGKEKIEKIKVGDYVITHKNRLNKVTNVIKREENECIYIINKDIKCTKNHEFFVIRKNYKENYMFQNIEEYAEWIRADELDKEVYCLLRITEPKKQKQYSGEDKKERIKKQIFYEPIEINSIKVEEYKGFVYDLEVEEDHSYTVNNIIVHNSICLTRVHTGNGMPQFTALQNAYEGKFNCKYNENPMILCDGGVRNAGDLVKALCFSDIIMSGYLFSGTDEACGEKVIINGRYYKKYSGSTTLKDKYVEGETNLIDYCGGAEEVIDKLLQGIRSGCSYQNCKNISELKKNGSFVKVNRIRR